MTEPIPFPVANTKRFLPTNTDIDLTNCDREPIHIPGRIQPFGALIAMTADGIITRVSANLEAMTGVAGGEDLIGTPIADVLSPEALAMIQMRIPSLQNDDAVERLFHKDLFGRVSLFDAALHMSGREIVLEVEPSATNRPSDYVGLVRPMIDRVQKTTDFTKACKVAARQLRALTGFDRVMTYRFGADGSGEVIAESVSASIPTSYLGLRYPASDIPKQARAMYVRNLLRIIADVNAPPVPLLPDPGAGTPPLDLSLSTTRAVSPIHIEYLRNMGVQASMSISIVVRGKLWGLFACHNYESPHILSYEVRTAAELFAQLFSFTIDQKLGDLRREEMVRARIIHDQIMASLADGTTISDNFDTIADAIADVIPYNGIAAWVDGEFTMRGSTPTREEFAPLARFLNTTPAGEIYSTHNIAAVFPKGADFVMRAAGMLALPVSRRPRDYLVLFRSEVAKEVVWAGDPDKPVELGPQGARLQPRKSFEAWAETVHGQSEPWTDGQISAAQSLRMTLLEVVLRITDQAVHERTRAQEQQELLIAELNHRVRNILKLIQGLVAQSEDSKSVAEFTRTVGGRIHALARAHDQITQENWTPASLHDLVMTEAEAYLGEAADRVRVSGSDALIAPSAFTSLSLVIHEMMTNAMKYGALSVQSGRVDIVVGQTAIGGLDIGWTETGGPPVSVPTRRGFGTTITERSIPFELSGTAHVAYETEGVRAQFTLPPDHVAEFRERRAADPLANDNRARGGGLSGNALVVEDNLIIALDAEDMLRELGAEDVFVCSSVSEALHTLRDRDVHFALLDVNLGSQTSEPVAEALDAANVPYVFATGYGEGTRLATDRPDTPVLQKPYGLDNIASALAKLFG